MLSGSLWKRQGCDRHQKRIKSEENCSNPGAYTIVKGMISKEEEICLIVWRIWHGVWKR